MDRSAVQAWLDRYVEAWKSYDPDAIGSLFAEDATYRYHPFDSDDAVVRGRDAIVRAWVEPEGNASSRDAANSFDAHYEPYAVDGDRAVSVGWSRYWSDGTRSKHERTYDNVYLLRFDDEGRCVDFTEWYVKRPDPAT